ncbi:Spo0E family sporulation regulatory protein-aspartic acid phosphatase [Peribacillus sp. SCS-155]|uniref:Spo0E family sporulation regulatory protein-aspartic acid phosphatase n=1 Tax=Peribacillus sedimenti TaxID=3115297 RepID=UPI0039066C9D
MNVNHYSTLISTISIKRKEMITNAEEYGLTHKRTLNSSQELDKLINEYLHLKNNCGRS